MIIILIPPTIAEIIVFSLSPEYHEYQVHVSKVFTLPAIFIP